MNWNDKLKICMLDLTFGEENEFEMEAKEFFDYYIKSDRTVFYFEEVISFENQAVKPFITIKYPRGSQFTSKNWNNCIRLFKQHLVDCEFIKNLDEIKGVWGLDYSNDNEIVLRFIFDCGLYYFGSCLLLQNCLKLFKERLLSDPKNEAMIKEFTYFDKEEVVIGNKLKFWKFSRISIFFLSKTKKN